MAPLVKEVCEQDKREKKLFQELDKGIDDMEQGKTVAHEEAMKIIREMTKFTTQK